jgi:hypothetical protein
MSTLTTIHSLGAVALLVGAGCSNPQVVITAARPTHTQRLSVAVCGGTGQPCGEFDPVFDDKTTALKLTVGIHVPSDVTQLRVQFQEIGDDSGFSAHCDQVTFRLADVSKFDVQVQAPINVGTPTESEPPLGVMNCPQCITQQTCDTATPGGG